MPPVLWRSFSFSSLLLDIGDNKNMLKPGMYQHYKGGYYELIGIALHTETREKMVVYKSLQERPDLEVAYGKYPVFVRPFKMFVDEVEVNGEKRPRFAWVREK